MFPSYGTLERMLLDHSKKVPIHKLYNYLKKCAEFSDKCQAFDEITQQFYRDFPIYRYKDNKNELSIYYLTGLLSKEVTGIDDIIGEYYEIEWTMNYNSLNGKNRIFEKFVKYFSIHLKKKPEEYWEDKTYMGYGTGYALFNYYNKALIEIRSTDDYYMGKSEFIIKLYFGYNTGSKIKKKIFNILKKFISLYKI